MEKDVQARLKLALETGDPEIVYDLRHHNPGRRHEFDAFWDAAKGYTEASAMQAVDSRRHGQVCNMATALSTRDLIDQVKARLPPGTPVPCHSWVHFQFWPKNPFSKAAMQYSRTWPGIVTGRRSPHLSAYLHMLHNHVACKLRARADAEVTFEYMHVECTTRIGNVVSLRL